MNSDAFESRHDARPRGARTDTGERSDECRHWETTARSLLVEPASLFERSRLDEHLASCSACRANLSPLLEADATLRDAYRALETIVPAPSGERVRRILEEAATPGSDDAALIRRIRRPVNTVLWVTVLAFTTAGLAALAYLIYWVLLRQ